jgi:hypothetical protein
MYAVIHLYSLVHIIWLIKSRRMEWAGHIGHMREREICTGLWGGGGEPERKRLLGRPRHTWKDVIETAWHGMHWIHLAQDRDRWW